MAAFVSRNNASIHFTHHEGSPCAELYVYQRLLKALAGKRVKATTGGTERRFIDQVRQFCSTHAYRQAGQSVQAYIIMQRGTARMYAQNRLAPKPVGESDGDLTIKASRTQQRPAQHVNAVGCGQDNEPATRPLPCGLSPTSHARSRTCRWQGSGVGARSSEREQRPLTRMVP